MGKLYRVYVEAKGGVSFDTDYADEVEGAVKLAELMGLSYTISLRNDEGKYREVSR